MIRARADMPLCSSGDSTNALPYTTALHFDASPLLQ